MRVVSYCVFSFDEKRWVTEDWRAEVEMITIKTIVPAVWEWI